MVHGVGAPAGGSVGDGPRRQQPGEDTTCEQEKGQPDTVTRRSQGQEGR